MNAQQLIDECETYHYDKKKVRNELNISWLINDVLSKFKEEKL